jgi:Cu(I)/Ag(I) efflux system protein CusF
MTRRTTLAASGTAAVRSTEPAPAAGRITPTLQEHMMKPSHPRLAALATAACLLATPAWAQTGHGSHGAHGGQAAADRTSDFVDAEVRRIDAGRQRVTLRHAEIKDLAMPPMTMVFAVAEPAMLQRLQAGDRVQVRIAQRGSTYTITELRPAP